MIIDDVKVQNVFDGLEKYYNYWMEEENMGKSTMLFDWLMGRIVLLVDLGIEPDKEYEWSQLYYATKGRAESRNSLMDGD